MRALHAMESGRLLGGEYRVLRMLAEGGMGVVYEAEQVSTGARRAVKVLRAPGRDSETWRVRFERDVRVSTAIDSDHGVHMVGAGIDVPTGLPWIAMELLDGEDLAQRLKREPVLDVATVRAMAGQLGHALAAAHEAKIVHRDLKPANVFLARSRIVGLPFVVKVLDFGIAKWLTDSSATPTPNVGTPAFMAPEQCGGATAIGASADVWALGLLVFRMLTGHSFWLATREENPPLAALMREVLFEPIPSASGCESSTARRWTCRGSTGGSRGACIARPPRASRTPRSRAPRSTRCSRACCSNRTSCAVIRGAIA